MRGGGISAPSRYAPLRLRNYRTNRASFFEYDHAGRCMASRERAFTVTNGAVSYGAIVSSYGYQYDECNHLSKLTCSVLGSSWSTVYTYDSDNRPSTTTMSSGKVITNTYDAIGRLSNRAIGLSSTYNTAVTYVPGNSSSKTTGLVSTYRNGSDDAYSYAYDENGNITSITQGTTSIGYVYDTSNRLIRENNQVTNETVTYEYDQFGNIKSKKTYAYSTGDLTNATYTEIEYEYEEDGWNDQLTEYDGQEIEYDLMGNPTTYRGYNMTWRGKQLAGISGGTKNVSFEYNEDGLRQKKTYNGVETNYYYNGSVLIGMQRGQTKYLFSYDASGNVVSVTNQNNEEFFYIRNAQGDIVEIIDSTGAVKVQYTYDTWGKKVQTTGTLAGTLGLFQPFRYRGYVYDWETGLYYLQSRYYDPEVGRFISSDVLLSTGQGVMGHNAYAYCLGNPVNMADDGGSIPSFSVDRPDTGPKREPPDPPTIIIFTIPEFEFESNYVIPIRFRRQSCEAIVVTFESKEEFVALWNHYSDTNATLIINAHGSYLRIVDNKSFIITISDIKQLKKAKYRSVVLLCCCNGKEDESKNNVANAFASRIDGLVYASDSKVEGWTLLSCDNSEGWFAYQGGNGAHWKVSDCFLNWGNIL